MRTSSYVKLSMCSCEKAPKHTLKIIISYFPGATRFPDYLFIYLVLLSRFEVFSGIERQKKLKKFTMTRQPWPIEIRGFFPSLRADSRFGEYANHEASLSLRSRVILARVPQRWARRLVSLIPPAARTLCTRIAWVSDRKKCLLAVLQWIILKECYKDSMRVLFSFLLRDSQPAVQNSNSQRIPSAVAKRRMSWVLSAVPSTLLQPVRVRFGQRETCRGNAATDSLKNLKYRFDCLLAWVRYSQGRHSCGQGSEFNSWFSGVMKFFHSTLQIENYIFLIKGYL